MKFLSCNDPIRNKLSLWELGLCQHKIAPHILLRRRATVRPSRSVIKARNSAAVTCSVQQNVRNKKLEESWEFHLPSNPNIRLLWSLLQCRRLLLACFSWKDNYNLVSVDDNNATRGSQVCRSWLVELFGPREIIVLCDDDLYISLIEDFLSIYRAHKQGYALHHLTCRLSSSQVWR
jgi:hypothetical protein